MILHVGSFGFTVLRGAAGRRALIGQELPIRTGGKN